MINPYKKIFTWKTGKDELEEIAEDLEKLKETIEHKMAEMDDKEVLKYIAIAKDALNTYMDKIVVDNINYNSRKYYASKSGVIALGHQYDKASKKYIPKIAMDKQDNPKDNSYKIDIEFCLDMSAEYIGSLELSNGKKLTESKQEFMDYMDKEIFFISIIDVWYREDPIIGAVAKDTIDDDWIFYT